MNTTARFCALLMIAAPLCASAPNPRPNPNIIDGPQIDDAYRQETQKLKTDVIKLIREKLADPRWCFDLEEKYTPYHMPFQTSSFLPSNVDDEAQWRVELKPAGFDEIAMKLNALLLRLDLAVEELKMIENITGTLHIGYTHGINEWRIMMHKLEKNLNKWEAQGVLYTATSPVGAAINSFARLHTAHPLLVRFGVLGGIAATIYYFATRGKASAEKEAMYNMQPQPVH